MHLIHRSQLPWAIVTGVLSSIAGGWFWWENARLPGGVSGGSFVGVSLGAAGLLCMAVGAWLWVMRRCTRKKWLLFSRKSWLKAHVWLGILAVPLLLFHSGFGWGGWLEGTLWVLLILVVATGLFGLLMQQTLPRVMSDVVRNETPLVQIPHVCWSMVREADALMEKVCGRLAAATSDSTADPQTAYQRGISRFYLDEVRPYLSPRAGRSRLASPLTAETLFDQLRGQSLPQPALALVTHIEALCRERRGLARQERIHFWLHGWLYLHVPLSMALLLLGVVHAVASLWY